MKKLFWIIIILIALLFPCLYIEASPINSTTANKTVVYKKESHDIDIYTKAEAEYSILISELDTVQNDELRDWFLCYKALISKYSFAIDRPEVIYDYYSPEEITLMERCIETEGYQADFASKVNIACVILNRINSEDFQDSVYGVITAENQFAYGRTEISSDSKLALEFAFEIEDTTDGCIAFHSNRKGEFFNNWEYVFTDAVGHNFYREVINVN